MATTETAETVELEQRTITITLPAEVWKILDGSNELAQAANVQGFEEWIASMILRSVLDCLNTAISSMAPTGAAHSHHAREGNA